jgi:hypothetical protein
MTNYKKKTHKKQKQQSRQQYSFSGFLKNSTFYLVFINLVHFILFYKCTLFLSWVEENNSTEWPDQSNNSTEWPDQSNNSTEWPDQSNNSTEWPDQSHKWALF